MHGYSGKPSAVGSPGEQSKRYVRKATPQAELARAKLEDFAIRVGQRYGAGSWCCPRDRLGGAKPVI